MISRRQIISRSAGPIFVIFTSHESFVGVDDRSGPLFFGTSRDVAMVTDFVQKWGKIAYPFPCTYRSVIQKRYGITPCVCKIK